MAKFAYNNAKNANTRYTLFKLNYGYHPYVSYEKDLDPHSKLITAEKPFSKLQNFMIVYQQNFHHTQKL